MRDFRDAKAMAQTLRSALSIRAIHISHSDSLELVSKMFGIGDWNTMSAQIELIRRQTSAPSPRTEMPQRRCLAIPVRDLVPFPGATYPVFAGRAKTVQTLAQASKQRRDLIIALQKTSSIDEPTVDDVYEIGVLASILDFVRLDDGTAKVLMQAHRRILIAGFNSEPRGYMASVEDLSEGPIPEAADLIRIAVTRFAAYASSHNLDLPQAFFPTTGKIANPDLVADIVSKRIGSPGWVADIIAARITLPIRDSQSLLATVDPVTRLERVMDLLQKNA